MHVAQLPKWFRKHLVLLHSLDLSIYNSSYSRAVVQQDVCNRKHHCTFYNMHRCELGNDDDSNLQYLPEYQPSCASAGYLPPYQCNNESALPDR